MTMTKIGDALEDLCILNSWVLITYEIMYRIKFNQHHPTDFSHTSSLIAHCTNKKFIIPFQPVGEYLNLNDVLRLYLYNDKSPREKMYIILAFLNRIKPNFLACWGHEYVLDLIHNPHLFIMLDDIEMFNFHINKMNLIDPTYNPKIIWKYTAAIISAHNINVYDYTNKMKYDPNKDPDKNENEWLIRQDSIANKEKNDFSEYCTKWLIKYNIQINASACEMAAIYDNMILLKMLRNMNPPCPWDKRTNKAALRNYESTYQWPEQARPFYMMEYLHHNGLDECRLSYLCPSGHEGVYYYIDMCTEERDEFLPHDPTYIIFSSSF